MEINPSLTAEDIKNAVNEKLESYKDLNFLEQYAMYLGNAQILEFLLKGLLARKYLIPYESMEKWTLGKVKNELSRNGLRQDFIVYLGRVVDHRNYIAHDLLELISKML